MSRNFAITGVAGYIAPRHLRAIKENGHQLVAAVDPFDSVGIIDSFFPQCEFFTEYERFDRHLEKCSRSSHLDRIHMVSVCSPNYLHDAHIRTALRVGADALCEKPLVLNPWNLDMLQELEAETGCRVWTVLQLRLHSALLALKAEVSVSNRQHDVDLTYVTSRGSWYMRSWKNHLEKSGGVATNIGIHFFDLLIWLFGAVEKVEVHVSDEKTCAGYLELASARVRWFLSIDSSDVPEERLKNGQRTYRSLILNGEEVEFSEGFTDLHNEVYKRTLAGDGFGIEDAKPSIALAQQIRTKDPIGTQHYSHPFLK